MKRRKFTNAGSALRILDAWEDPYSRVWCFAEGDGEDDAGGGGEGEGDAGGKDAGADDGGKSVRDAAAEGTLFEGNEEKPKGKEELEAGRPEGLPDKFWDPEKGEVRTESLSKSYTELQSAYTKIRQDKGIAGEVPTEAAGYLGDKASFDVPAEADRVGEVKSDDPGLQVFANVAHKHGLTKDQFYGVAADFMKEFNQHMPEPVNPEAEREKLGDNPQDMIARTEAWFSGLYTSGAIDQDVYSYCYAMGQTADGLLALNAFRALSGEMPMPNIDSGEVKSGMTPAQYEAAYKQAVADKDYDKQAELDALNFYGSQSAGQSTPGRNPQAPGTKRSVGMSDLQKKTG